MTARPFVLFVLLNALALLLALTLVGFDMHRLSARLTELERLQRAAPHVSPDGTVHMQRLVIGGRP